MSKKSKHLEEALAVNNGFIRGRKPVKCALDFEISPMLVYTYEAYEGNALKVKVLPQVVAVAWQINDEPIQVRTLNQYKRYKPGIFQINDKPLIEEIAEVLDGVDIIYGHNVRDFDLKHLRARMVYHKLSVPKRWIVEDTLKIARTYFKFPKNNLDFLTETLGMEGKTDVKHSDVIWKCIDGDPNAWKSMGAYVKQDIKITVGLYTTVAPWHETHYNLNLISRKAGAVCTVCLSINTMKRGLLYLKTGIKQRHQCKDCANWWTGEIIARAPKAEKVEKEVERVT